MLNSKAQTAEDQCPTCGRARSEWRADNSLGFSKNGQTYCCEGCATGGHCTCDLMQTAPRLERNTNKTESI